MEDAYPLVIVKMIENRYYLLPYNYLHTIFLLFEITNELDKCVKQVVLVVKKT